MRVGVVSSSEGIVFREMHRAVQSWDVSFDVVTDRECGIEAVSDTLGVSRERIQEADREAFSRRAAERFAEQGIDYALLFFNRLVSADLYAALPTFNVHPSLLPAFPGLTALEGAELRGVRFLGATLLLVTEEPDGGPIVAQTCAPVPPGCSTECLAEISFVQRVCLAVLSVELQRDRALRVDPGVGTVEQVSPRPYTPRCNPAVQDPGLVQTLRELEQERGIAVTQPEA
jgi:folate-dependent phosphoribosylglycinamide formyltransferase PurN